MEIPKSLRYTKEHEWVSVKGNEATVGITHFAQQALGDITYIELPAIGKALKKDEALGVVESVKAVSDIYAPVSGKVLAVNSPLLETPEKVNSSPYEEGWMLKLEMQDPKSELEGLLDAEGYIQFVEDQI